MTALLAWGGTALIASTALMLLVLLVRAPVHQWVGPRLGYALWALPALRLILPALPQPFAIAPITGQDVTAPLVLFVGPDRDAGLWSGPGSSLAGPAVLAVWLVGALGLLALYASRHAAFCRRLRAEGDDLGRLGTIRVIATGVEGPLAFGVWRRFIAVPRSFATDYDAEERELALAHEAAHHVRGDLIANWASLVVLAAHWWNPVAWIAIRAFRADQELAADAHVLAAIRPVAVPSYARVLAKAAGVGAPPACSLNARSNLKGRLMMLGRKQRPGPRLAIGGAILALLGGAALAATATMAGPPAASAGRQAVTIGVKPDGAGRYALIVGRAAVSPGARLPDGMTLPADFEASGGCDLTPAAKPYAMVIKGTGATQTYTVMCAGAAPAPVRATLAEGLASLATMRASVATQPASSAFPETERAHALGAIDRSIREVESTLSALG